MIKNFFLLLLSLQCLTLRAQDVPADSWTITWNKKVILQTGTSDETANVLKIKRADLKKNYVLGISYKEADAKKEKEWKRSFIFFDEADKEIVRKDNTRQTKMPAAELKKILGDKTTIKIYTLAIPADPDVAARVRVRRVYLCTIKLQ